MKIVLNNKQQRHGNCVPFVVMNTDKKMIVMKGSLDEVAKLLGITSGYASALHISGKLYKKVYLIQRVGFETVTIC